MNLSDLPPLNSLRAFAALAETESYSRAGRLLNVSHAAVVQQVKALEGRLGVRLAVREGRGVKLTREGALLSRDLVAGFIAIGRGIEMLTGDADRRPVQVSMSPAFALNWLMPRLVDFQGRHPDITLMLDPTSKLRELRPGGIDLAIRYQDRTRLTGEVNAVLVADMVVVGTPGLVGGRDFTDPAEFTRAPWLQELGTNEVADWLALRGIEADGRLSISHMPGNLIMEAVRRGDGITYTARPWVEEDIRAGRLVELASQDAYGIYYIRTAPGPLRPPVKVFVQWLRQQASADCAPGVKGP